MPVPVGSLRLLVLVEVDPAGGWAAARLRAALRGGATLVQLRGKNLSSRRYLEAGREALELCRGKGVPLLINDRPDVARGIGADGAHVGPGDLPPLPARRLLGKGILGVSACTVERVRLAEGAGADFLGVGALRGSVTKPEAVSLGLEGVAALLRSTSLPVVVIGGVQPADVPVLRGAGAAGVAVLSGIMNAPDPERAARAYREAWERT